MMDAPFNLDDLNRTWSTLLSQLIVDRLILEKQVQQLRLENDELLAENKSLRSELNQAETNLLAVQGKQAIDKGQIIQE
jgi:cell division protein FtsB